MAFSRNFFALAVTILLAAPSFAQVQSREDATVDAATGVLNQIMAVPASKITESLLANAHGLAIIPNMVKGGFVVGVRYGKGLVLVRDEAGNWRPPTFITMTGGSLGFQAGLQSTDVILVFKTQKSVQGLMNGKFTIGADAAAAAGPVGRQAAVATDAQLGAEIYSYSRSRGLFAGVALDGSVLQVDAAANQTYYQAGAPAPTGQPAPLPASSVKLLETIAKYTTVPAGAEPLQGAPVVAGNPGLAPGQPLVPGTVPGMSAVGPAVPSVRQELTQASARLQPLLDDQWKQYLALPAGLVDPRKPISPQAVQASLSRFQTVTQNPSYATLAQRPEFQSVLQLLQKYQAELTQRGQPALTLPPPPAGLGAAPGQATRF